MSDRQKGLCIAIAVFVLGAVAGYLIRPVPSCDHSVAKAALDAGWQRTWLSGMPEPDGQDEGGDPCWRVPMYDMLGKEAWRCLIDGQPEWIWVE